MQLKRGDKVTLTNAMKKSVRDPRRYRIGTVVGSCGNGMLEILWGEKHYSVCMREDEVTKLRENPQMLLF